MKETLIFIGQIARRFRTTGAIAPSGRSLARAMVQKMGPVADGQVILELGPGTGVFTRELSRRFPHNRIVAIELNDAFATRIEKTLPKVAVIRGCASKLDEHLQSLDIAPSQVAAVVSGLPLLSLPKELGRNILSSVTSVLQPGRKYVQFTYSERAWNQFDVPGFDRQQRHRVWLNLPPAVVLSFVRTA